MGAFSTQVDVTPLPKTTAVSLTVVVGILTNCSTFSSSSGGGDALDAVETARGCTSTGGEFLKCATLSIAVMLLRARPQFPQKRAFRGSSEPQNGQVCIVGSPYFKRRKLKLLHEDTQRGEDALAQYRIPGALQPLIGGQFPGVGSIRLEQRFHFLGQRFTIDLGVELIVAHRTEAIQIGRPDGGP